MLKKCNDAWLLDLHVPENYLFFYQVWGEVTAAILKEVLPVIENAVDGFTATTKEQAKDETGWCKIRDGIVLPLLMQGGIYIVKTVLEKTVAETA